MPDTIVALSSGALPSGVAVIRLSGPDAGPALRDLVGTLPAPRQLTLATIHKGGDVLDRGFAVWFPAPHSFTGDDCAELQVHGSPAVVRAILATLTARENVRLAGAGEFTRRAFENGKLELTRVEGLGDLIAAETEGQRKQALGRLRGDLSNKVAPWREGLLDLRAEVEAQLDFADEGDVGTLPPDFFDRLGSLGAAIAALADDAVRGRIVREGVRIALAGPPNAGKSSLLNALAKSDIAIVTDEPGTTRDVRDVQIDLEGRLAILVDMAGLRETASKAEAEGIRRAREELDTAHLVLWLEAPDLPHVDPAPTSAPLWRIGTKLDLGTVESADLSVSVKTGQGINVLVERLSRFVQEIGGAEPPVVSRLRDQAALTAAAVALDRASAGLPLELVAEELRSASAALDRLVGRLDAEAVLDRLFLGFCIGK